MFDVVRCLEPVELVAAWRPRSRLLQLEAASPPSPGDRAEVRIRVAGRGAEAVILGTVAAVRREGGRFRVDVAPASSSLPSMARLLAAAGVDPAHRLLRHPPRYPADLPATASFRDASTIAVTAVSVSDGGCCLAMLGPPPPVGQVLRLRVPTGDGEAEVAGTVCWRALEPRSAIGVQFAGSRSPARWSALVAEIARRSRASAHLA